jgi:hypothetical protein
MHPLRPLAPAHTGASKAMDTLNSNCQQHGYRITVQSLNHDQIAAKHLAAITVNPGPLPFCIQDALRAAATLLDELV